MATTGTTKERTVDGARERKCSRCAGWKAVEDFYMMGGMPSWRCKMCQVAVSAEYVARNPERRKATARRSRFNQSLKYYGLTRDEFDAMVLSQEGRCAICVEPKALQIDHDHASGKVRGLLCGECNKALGLLNDDPSVIAEAIIYLGSRDLDETIIVASADDEGHFAYARMTHDQAIELHTSLEAMLFNPGVS